MLPEIGASELLIIAVVALIVVGPKDLPVLLRKLGQFMAKLRGMASEFRASFDEMARQSELDDLRKEVEAMRRGQYDAATATDADVNQTFSDIHHGLSDAEPGAGDYGYSGYDEAAPITVEQVAPPKPTRTRKAPARAAAAKPAAKSASSKATPAPATKSAPARRKPKAAAEPKS